MLQKSINVFTPVLFPDSTHISDGDTDSHFNNPIVFTSLWLAGDCVTVV